MKFLILLVTLLATVMFAQDNTEAEIPSKEDQIAAALLAAPPNMREGATVMGFDPSGELVVLQAGTSGMICLADDPTKPGYNSAAYHEDLEPFMARGRALRAMGKSRTEIFDMREVEAKAGTLKMPKDGATLHILYGKEGYYDAQKGETVNTFYRYVVYIPWATSASTGLPERPNTPGGPWIMDPGTHRAHIMITPPPDVQKKDE